MSWHDRVIMRCGHSHAHGHAGNDKQNGQFEAQ
jgi:hypothetical protein